MDPTLLATFGVIGTLATSAGAITNAAIYGLTMKWPDRPGWVALGGALVVALSVTFLLAAASLPLEMVWTRQTYAQISLAGISAWLTAVGLDRVGDAAATRQAKRRAKPSRATVVADPPVIRQE